MRNKIVLIDTYGDKLQVYNTKKTSKKLLLYAYNIKIRVRISLEPKLIYNLQNFCNKFIQGNCINQSLKLIASNGEYVLCVIGKYKFIMLISNGCEGKNITLDKSTAIQLRDFLNKFLEANNE